MPKIFKKIEDAPNPVSDFEIIYVKDKDYDDCVYKYMSNGGKWIKESQPIYPTVMG